MADGWTGGNADFTPAGATGWVDEGADATTGNAGFAEEGTNTGFAPNGFAAEGDGGDRPHGDIREAKINKKKFAEIENEGPLQIWYKSKVNKSTNDAKDKGIYGVPREAAAICSDMIYERVKKKGQKDFTIYDDNLAPYKFVFDWIKQCADEREVAKLPEIQDLITENTGLQPIFDVMVVAHKLKIPKASFNKFFIRKLQPLARQYLVDLDTVARIYDTLDEEYNDLDLREIAVTSIFDHWYNYKLDDEAHLDYMCKLEEMREGIKDLEDDLHKAVEDKNVWLKEMREKKKATRATEGAGAAGDDGFGATGTGIGVGSDWDTAGAGAATTGVDENWANAGGDGGKKSAWDQSDLPVDGGSTDWADEANTQASFNPAPVTAGGW